MRILVFETTQKQEINTKTAKISFDYVYMFTENVSCSVISPPTPSSTSNSYQPCLGFNGDRNFFLFGVKEI